MYIWQFSGSLSSRYWYLLQTVLCHWSGLKEGENWRPVDGNDPSYILFFRYSFWCDPSRRRPARWKWPSQVCLPNVSESSDSTQPVTTDLNLLSRRLHLRSDKPSNVLVATMFPVRKEFCDMVDLCTSFRLYHQDQTHRGNKRIKKNACAIDNIQTAVFEQNTHESLWKETDQQTRYRKHLIKTRRYISSLLVD